MSAPPFTAEILRNARIQLRPRRVIAAVVICAAISLTTYAYYVYLPGSTWRVPRYNDMFQWIVILQIIALVIGGGIYCLQSVHREMVLNTFDYQRVTRLTPLELALGKLFGAPALMTLVALCMLPAALFAAFAGGAFIQLVLEIYAIVLLGSIAFQAFALTISVFLGRGTSAGAIIFFLAFVWISSAMGSMAEQPGSLALHGVAPFAAASLTRTSGWPEDVFFGWTLSHGVVLAAIYLIFIGWFLLATSRNIKRDPAVYEVFSPIQAFGFLLFLNLIVLGFFRWSYGEFVDLPSEVYRKSAVSPSDAESTLLIISLFLFVIFGLTLLRNRDRSRRRIRELGARAASWLTATWPAVYVLLGAILVGGTLVAMLQTKLRPGADWPLSIACFEVAVFIAWLLRDLLFLQWMNLRRSRRPLVAGVLYLIVFYVCAISLLAAFSRVDRPKGFAYFMTLFPGTSFSLDLAKWTAHESLWIAALLVLCAEAVPFIWLQRRTLRQILASAPGADAASAPVTST